MKKLLHKIVLLIACLLTFVSCGKTQTPESCFIFSEVEGGYSIVLKKMPANGKVYIPSTYNGKDVVEIGNNAFLEYTELVAVDIPATITSIGDRAFCGCESLTSIEIPKSVINLGGAVFYGCPSLTIYCEASDHPSGWADNWNSSYRPVYWEINENNYLVREGIIYVIVDGNAVITGHTNELSDDIDIKDTIKIKKTPYNVTSIGGFAFYGCTSLTSIVIPNHVTSIEWYAFYNCRSLTTIDIPNSVTYIGEYAFSDCRFLTSVTFEEESKLESIEKRTFNCCTSLTSIAIPNSVTKIGISAFDACSALTSIMIPNSIVAIESVAFYGCVSLVSVSFKGESQLLNIGSMAFGYCSSLTSIVIPSSVTSIGDYTFLYCDSLTIYCEASSKPSGWDSDWNKSNRPVYWEGEWSYVNGVPTPR